MEPVRIGLIGVGGYARVYYDRIPKLEPTNLARLAAVVIRSRGKYPEQEKELADRGVPIRRSFEEMLEKDGDRLDIAAIPTGIDSHKDLMIKAAEAGLNVILEKPSAATIQDLDEMIATLERTGKFCAVGFQSQYDPIVVGLKREICAGRLGRIKEVIAVGNWRRTDDYYERNPWAGRFMLNGRYVLDGTINNPLAHYLFNALYFASPQWGRAAAPLSVRAELYRAHKIESEDTSCLEMTCDSGARVYFYGSLCGRDGSVPPVIEVFGEKSRAVWTAEKAARLFEGDRQTHEITNPGIDPRLELFRNAARYLRGLDAELNCPLAMTRPHVLAVNGAFESAGRPVTIPREHLRISTLPESGKVATGIIPDITELSLRAVAERRLYSDLGVEWARRTSPFSLDNYARFDIRPPAETGAPSVQE